MLTNEFAVFILTHGRPNNVKTLKTLKKCGYNGPILFIVDNEDKCISEYQKNFGTENVKIFDKKALADSIDEGNNFDERRTITHSRNACFDIAKEAGIRYFMQLDDDYTGFQYKLQDVKLRDVRDINELFELMINFYKTIRAHAIAFSQGGDFIGGIDNGKGIYRFSKRKCMNSFLCSTDRPFKFVGAMNEDVNTYTTLGSRGALFLTIPFVAVIQAATQSQKSGITDMYLRFGTYCKAFTTTMMHPSSVEVSIMQTTHTRIHHSIKWATTVPCIVSDKYKKL